MTTAGSKTTTTAADSQGRLVKLTNLSSGSPTAAFNATLAPDAGNSTAAATAVNSNGNVYTIGTSTGDFGNELNQGTQDVVLTKYNSAGNLQWSKLLGSAGSAQSYSLAINSSNNIVVAGSTTANLSPSGIADGNSDSFVAKYDAAGNQSWVTQIPTLQDNTASTVSVDSSGNIYIGGQVTGLIGSGQTNNGGADGYVAQLNSKGNIAYEQQLGTSGTDSVAATAVASDGSLYVASVQNGDAILTKYANGDATSAAVWQEDLGALGNGGSIGGLAVSGGKVYLSGTSTNAALTSGGQASVVGSTSGGLDAFVAGFTDSGSSVSADTVTYVGTSGTDAAGKLTVDSAGTVYLTGTTTGTFAGQTRNVAGTQNAFVTCPQFIRQCELDAAIWRRQRHLDRRRRRHRCERVERARRAGPAAGHDRYQPVGRSRFGHDAEDRRFLPTQDRQRRGQPHRHHHHRGWRDDGFTGRQDQQRALDVGQGIRDICPWRPRAEDRGQQGHLGDADRRARRSRRAGPAGISPGTIANGASTASSSSSSSSSSKQTFGLGFSGRPLDILSKTDAGAARAELLNVLSTIRNAYRTTNTPDLGHEQHAREYAVLRDRIGLSSDPARRIISSRSTCCSRRRR